MIMEVRQLAAVEQAGKMTCEMPGHLLGGLGAGWYRLLTPGRDAGGTIPDDENPGLSARAQGSIHHYLVEPVDLQTGNPGKKIRSAHPRRPHRQPGMDPFPLPGDKAFGVGPLHHGAGMDLHAHGFEAGVGGAGYPLRQRRQNARGCLDQVHAQLITCKPVMAVTAQHGHRMMKLRSQFHARGATTHNGHRQGLRVVIGMETGVEKALTQALGLLLAVQEETVFGNTGSAEIIAATADRQHQPVVAQVAAGQHNTTGLIMQRRQCDPASPGIQIRERSRLEPVVIVAGMGTVVHGIQVRAHRPGGHFVKARLPYMDGTGIDQHHLGLAIAPQGPAQPGNQGQTAGAATDHYNPRNRHLYLSPARKGAKSRHKSSIRVSPHWLTPAPPPAALGPKPLRIGYTWRFHRMPGVQMKPSVVRIATRSSPLAVWQAEHVQGKLEEAHPGLKVELLPVKTRGDRILDTPLAKIGGKGLFIKELEEAMLDGRADIAVHSMKDVPMELPDGMALPVICKRGDPRDAFVSHDYGHLDELPEGARLGTSSLRRQSLARARRPDLEVLSLRGNVQTRLGKLDAGEFDAILLASAGLRRLGMEERIRCDLEPEVMLPAVGQGAIGIECREDDASLRELLMPLEDRDTRDRLSAERAMNRRLEGGCQVPIAGHAILEDDDLWLRGAVGSEDGREVLRAEGRRARAEAAELGNEVAEALLTQGAGEILAEVYGTS